MRVIGGIVIFIIYYKNLSWGAYLPENMNGIFDNTGLAYNITHVLTPKNTVDIDSYKRSDRLTTGLHTCS